MSIEEQRRKAFEAWASGNGRWPQGVERSANGEYRLMKTYSDWQTWNAALDSVVIELPDRGGYSSPDAAGAAIFDCATNIKAAGVKVAP